MRTEIEQWPLVAPFRIAFRTFEFLDVVVVTLERDGHLGRGEGAGVIYKNENPASMVKQIESIRPAIEAGASRESLRGMLAPGGARNALDCALWDLEAKLSACPAWKRAELNAPSPLLMAFTCGADEPGRMAVAAGTYKDARAIKIKLTGEAMDAERVRAVRDRLPDVWLAVDANQALTRPGLDRLMPVLIETRVALIEQPFPVGEDALLDGLQSPIAIAADESIQSLADVPRLVGRFDVVNIKLDKCGGLTEGLEMARAARDFGFKTMVGNMIGTSLAMAPAFLLGQLCSVVDLDGPLFLKADRDITVKYSDGHISCPETLWGNVSAPLDARSPLKAIVR
jgi:L-alanine-DL-glutamate epimerase-like enolase superfamily enzyme